MPSLRDILRASPIRVGQDTSILPRLAIDPRLQLSTSATLKPLPARAPIPPPPASPSPAPVPRGPTSTDTPAPTGTRVYQRYLGPLREPLVAPELARVFRPSVTLLRLEPGLQRLLQCAWNDDVALSALMNLMVARAWVLTISRTSDPEARNRNILGSSDLQAAVREIAQRLRRPRLSQFVPGIYPAAPGQGLYFPRTPTEYAPQFEALVPSETMRPVPTWPGLDVGTQALVGCAWNDRAMLSSLIDLLLARVWLLTMQSRQYEYGGTAEGMNLAREAEQLQAIVNQLIARLRRL